ncbi:hypothetical protein CkaCkLH20_01493 [Colletotrichum karsti]|uniref:Uncharacterized protein n=1 Tax=Colletotrichum karsti TaxID=1095194 RepID=A0A9P6IEG3_9PEZI|nr:uncharacterized protein CkaCkLH20_01493 [Colletotrichum karsti]KAF9881343.1 hypothetical protein CkaCkLH20_01493 [Colletotrichum karsti]
MGKKSERKESFTDKEEGGAKIDAPVGDAMDIDSGPAPTDARAVRAARRKQRREELASQGHSATSSLASTPNPETEPAAAKSEKKSKKKSDKKSTPKKSETADVETDAPAATSESAAPVAESLPFVIDVKPSKPAVADTDSDSHSNSERGGSVAPSTANGGDGLNRAARRRLMQIEKHRGMIKKDLGIPAESDERQDEVDSLLAVWTAKFDEKAEIRAAKKVAKKEEIKKRGKGKGKGKGKQGRNSNDNPKQMKKQKQKQALRARQEAGSGTN